MRSESKREKEQKSFFKSLWDWWKNTARFFGKVNLYIATFIIYWTVFAITALILKLIRKDFLAVRGREKEESYWVPLHPHDKGIERHYKQF